MAFNGWMGFYGGLIGSNESNGNFNGIWLVVYLPLWKICESQLGWLLPIYGKNKIHVPTTNQ
jgi:hypothetical protein